MSLIMALILLWGLCHHDCSKPNYLPKALAPNTVILEIRASTYEFGGKTEPKPPPPPVKPTAKWEGHAF